MIRIFVNNIAFYIKKDISVLEALSFLGLRIPRFCYHEALSIAGNCRICLIEIDSSVKLVASCAQPILANMQIFSNTVKVLKARENVLESLLINHPLDCPICDQAGECDLQDQSKVFGGIYTRHIFSKRGVENKIIDPCIKTIMTRCIHCTRCVRFAAEITGKTFLGTLNRGRYTEIGGFISQLQDSSEVSGNVIDLCPVGALTAKPYAFKARPWELRSFETIDLTDGLGSNIYINLKELEVISVLPKNNPLINGQWISNKARFYVDSLQRYRISSGWDKTNSNVGIRPTKIIESLLSNSDISSKHIFMINEDTDLNTLRLLKKMENSAPNQIGVYNTSNFSKRSNYYYQPSTKIKTLDAANSSCFVLIAANIRTECAVINVKLRIKAKNKRINALSFGQRMESTFPVKFINITAGLILDVIEAKNISFSKSIFSKNQPIFLIGESFFKRTSLEINGLTSHLSKFNSNNLIIVINKKSNSEGIIFSNIKSLNSRINSTLKGSFYFCGLDDSLNVRDQLQVVNKKTIWLHTHGSQIATECAYIIPTLSYFESEGVFLNLEKRPQKAVKMLENKNPLTVYSLYEIINIIRELLNISISIKANNVASNALSYMEEIIQNPNKFDQIKPSLSLINNIKNNEIGVCSNYPFKPVISDYYLTNSYSKYSLNMTNYSNKKRIFVNTLLNLNN